MNAFSTRFSRTFVALCFFFIAASVSAQNVVTSSTRSAEKPREITRILRPEIVNRLRDDNVLVTQDVRHADKTALQRVARSGTFPTFIVITRTLPHPYKSAFTMARDVRLQLDVSSNAVVIVATEVDGYLAVDCEDIEYSICKQIAERSAMSWTNEGYAIGAAQTLRLVAAEREEQRVKRRWMAVRACGGALLFATFITLIWIAKRRPKNVAQS